VHRYRTFYDEGVFVGRHSLVAAVLAVGCVLARPISAAPDSHAVEYVHLAELIVNRSWKLERGERVVIFWDAKRDPGIALPLRAAIQRAMPYYGYGAGVVRLAIGDNWESGGRNRSSNGELLLFLPGATLSVDGRDLIRDGALIDR
jgi:hypothetical protein